MREISVNEHHFYQGINKHLNHLDWFYARVLFWSFIVVVTIRDFLKAYALVLSFIDQLVRPTIYHLISTRFENIHVYRGIASYRWYLILDKSSIYCVFGYISW